MILNLIGNSKFSFETFSSLFMKGLLLHSRSPGLLISLWLTWLRWWILSDVCSDSANVFAFAFKIPKHTYIPLADLADMMNVSFLYYANVFAFRIFPVALKIPMPTYIPPTDLVEMMNVAWCLFRHLLSGGVKQWDVRHEMDRNISICCQGLGKIHNNLSLISIRVFWVKSMICA